MMKLMRDISTGKDNVTYDNGRVMCLLSYIVYFAMGVASYFAGHPWSPIDFASGIGAMGVGFGVNLKLKEGSEPTKVE